MPHTFCFVEASNERGEDEWAVVCSVDREFWLASFSTEEAAINYSKEINALADQWRIGRIPC